MVEFGIIFGCFMLACIAIFVFLIPSNLSTLNSFLSDNRNEVFSYFRRLNNIGSATEDIRDFLSADREESRKNQEEIAKRFANSGKITMLPL